MGEHHWSDKSGYRPVGTMTQHKDCVDAECCQQACCDHKSTCSTWGFGTDATHSKSGCWIGKATHWQQEYGWLGGSGRAVGASTRSVAHTSSKFDGYYNLVMRADGHLQMDRIEPCQGSSFPVSYVHYKPTKGVSLVKDIDSARSCRQHCENDSACTSWAFSKVLGCYVGNPIKFVYDPNFVTCAAGSLAAEFVDDENAVQEVQLL